MIWDYQKTLAGRLLVWSAASIISAAILLVSGVSPSWRGFAIQALAWGAIDAAIALVALPSSLRRAALSPDVTEANRQADRLRRILWVNTFLDVLYVSGGVLIINTLGQTNPFMAGTGWGVVVQGGFLLLFDLTHALGVPNELTLPVLDWYPGDANAAFALPGGNKTALLIHGFAGSPAEMRSLAQALHRAGWSVRVPVLPGHGAGFHTLFQRRATEWVEFVQKEAREVQAEGQPWALVGFSMGASLALITAAQIKPDALVMLAPFWLPQNLFIRMVTLALRLALPPSLKVFHFLRLPEDKVREALHLLLPDLNPGDPALRAELERVRIPFVFLEQFLNYSRQVAHASRKLDVPSLVVQGNRDPVARPPLTQSLARRMHQPPRLVEVNGDHQMTLPESPALPAVIKAVVDFLDLTVTGGGEKPQASAGKETGNK